MLFVLLAALAAAGASSGELRMLYVFPNGGNNTGELPFLFPWSKTSSMSIAEMADRASAVLGLPNQQGYVFCW